MPHANTENEKKLVELNGQVAMHMAKEKLAEKSYNFV